MIHDRIMATMRPYEVSLWLGTDIQPPEIDVRFTPRSGHSEAHAGLPVLTHNGHMDHASIPALRRPSSHRLASASFLYTASSIAKRQFSFGASAMFLAQ